MSIPSAAECVDFGYWRDRCGRAGLVTWVRGDGRLLYIGPAGPELLAVIPSEQTVRQVMSGWEDAFPGGVDWVRCRVQAPVCPSCAGEGWVQSAHDDGASQVACWCRIEVDR